MSLLNSLKRKPEASHVTQGTLLIATSSNASQSGSDHDPRVKSAAVSFATYMGFRRQSIKLLELAAQEADIIAVAQDVLRIVELTIPVPRNGDGGKERAYEAVQPLRQVCRILYSIRWQPAGQKGTANLLLPTKSAATAEWLDLLIQEAFRLAGMQVPDNGAHH